MNIYNVEINGLGMSSSDNRFKILAKDMAEAYEIAEGMTNTAKENLWEDIELLEVSFDAEVTDPQKFKQAKIEEGEKIRKEAEKEGN